MVPQKKKNSSIELLRCLATIAVVNVHIYIAPVTANTGDLSPVIVSVSRIVHWLSIWSVPVFLMITGYCSGLHGQCTFKYVLKKAKKFAIVLFTIGLFYALLERFFNTRVIDFNLVFASLLDVLNGDTWDHMWYVYAVIGVYLTLPLFFTYFKNAEKPYALLILLFIFNIILPWVEKVTPVRINLHFPIGYYSFYVCLGLFLSTFDFDKLSAKLAIPVSILLIIGGVALMPYETETYGCNELGVCLMSIGIYMLVMKCPVRDFKGLYALSGCTWGIYLIHPVFINVAIKLFNIDFLSGLVYLKLFAFFVVVFCLSFLSVLLLKKIPVIKELF